MTGSAAISAMTEGEKVLLNKLGGAGLEHDEQIRHLALGHAINYASNRVMDFKSPDFTAAVRTFENYIREGTLG